MASRKTFGFHNRKDEGREGNVRTRGGLMYYGYDGLGSVTDLTDRTGDVAMKYRYDPFGDLFTGITSPYNTVGYTGKSYDPKASLLEFYARWYDPSVGRFTTQDSYLGTLMAPASQHRYAYVLNNPVSSVDQWGYMQEGDGGGDADFREWYTHVSEYSYTNERTVTSTSTKTEGNYRVTYQVETVYANKWKVVKTYYHNSLGISYFYDESAPQSLGTVVLSSSRTEISRVEIPDDDGTGDDEDDVVDDPKDEDVTDPVDGGGGGHHEPTPAASTYTTQTTSSYSDVRVSGDWVIYYDVTITYTDTWAVTLTYYHNSLGYSRLEDESAPRHVGRTSSTTRTETGREPLNGNPIDPPGDGTQPPIEEPPPNDGGRGGGNNNPPTEQERAAWKKQALLDAGADAEFEDQLAARQTITWGTYPTNSAEYPVYEATTGSYTKAVRLIRLHAMRKGFINVRNVHWQRRPTFVPTAPT